MRVIDSIWFTQMGNPGIIGVVQVFDEFTEDKFYIGTAPGVEQREDEQHIADTGAKFPAEVGKLLMKNK